MTARPDSGISAAALSKWRARHGYSLTTGADALGVNRTTFQRYLNGETPIPLTVALLAEAIDSQRQMAAELHGILAAAQRERWKLPFAGVIVGIIKTLEG